VPLLHLLLRLLLLPLWLLRLMMWPPWPLAGSCYAEGTHVGATWVAMSAAVAAAVAAAMAAAVEFMVVSIRREPILASH